MSELVESIVWREAPEFGRTESLKDAIDLLHSFGKESVTIVETGTTRGSLGGGVVGDGWATLAFGWYCKRHGGEVYTIDILEEAIDECKKITEPYKDVINYIVGDSVEFLSSFDKEVDLLYLDSSDDPQLIYKELRSILDKLTDTSLILIDDTHDGLRRGKGVIAGKFLLENMWFLIQDHGGQALFARPGVAHQTLFKKHQSCDLYELEQQLAEGSKIELSIEDYDDRAKVWHNAFFTRLPTREELPKVDDKVKVLDIGCHSGYNTKMLENIYGYAEGIDINPSLISASILNHDKCVQMPCNVLRYHDESFSLVVAKDVYEHSLDPTGSIKEAYRVLADGGYIQIMIPLDGEPGKMDDVTVHPSYYYGNKSHPWKATIDGVLSRLFDTGFTEVECSMLTHSGLFGVERTYGDRVLTVKAQKRKGIRMVQKKWLLGNPYCCDFITLICAGNCS